MTTKSILTTAALGVVALGISAIARAHISLERAGTPEQPATHLSRDGDDNLKAGPCGRAGSTRGTNVYTYEPGAKVTIRIAEFIPHPSYFRIAFDDDGDDDFIEPASIDPINKNRQCPRPGGGDHCGASDFYNSPTVLMDNLNPHLVALADYVQAPIYTWEVTMPDVECDNCTLQIIQVMEDDDAHGDYDPTPGVGVADIYHQCIDLVLKKGATGVDNPEPPSPDTGGGGPSGGATAGGSTTGGEDGSPATLADGGRAPGTTTDPATGTTNDTGSTSSSCAVLLGAQARAGNLIATWFVVMGFALFRKGRRRRAVA